MHAVVVTVSIEPGHREEAQAQLETNVLPRVKETPRGCLGILDAHSGWKAGALHGALRDRREAARAAADNIPNMPRPDFITFDNIDVREVVARV